MRAAVYHRYGEAADVVRIEEVDRPVPGDDEVLIAIRAAAANPMDVHLMRGKPAIARLAMGLSGPKLTRPGVDMAGIVEAVGANVTRFRPGDAVFGSCRGAFAEFGCVAETALAAKPAGISFAQAAAIPVAGLTALQGLRDRGIAPGHKVLIVGASGGIGTFAVQIAKAYGAEVTGVCSTANLDMVRSIGADRTIDYTQEDFTKSGERYDLILDAVGNLHFSSACRALTPIGMLVVAGAGMGPGGPRIGRLLGRLIGGLLLSRFSSRKFIALMAKQSAEDLAALGALAEAGTMKPVIDFRHGLDEAAAAISCVASHHARGKVVVTMEPKP